MNAAAARGITETSFWNVRVSYESFLTLETVLSFNNPEFFQKSLSSRTKNMALSHVTLSSIREDAEFASKEHSWYKHLAWPSTTCVIGFVDAVTIRERSPNYEGPNGTHLAVIPDGFPRPDWADAFTTSVQLTPMFRGVEEAGTRYAHLRNNFFEQQGAYEAFLKTHGMSPDPPKDQELKLWEEEHERMINLIVEKAAILARPMGLLKE
jgi:hypothetical protein